jgi:catabolite repression protein CreC
MTVDPIALRYGRLNKQVRLSARVYPGIDDMDTSSQGRISNSPCTAVRWVPSSPNLFLVSHADGTIVVYDKDREDGVFTPQAPTASLASLTNDPAPTSPEASSSAGEWNPLDSIFVTIPPWHPVNSAGAQAGGGRGDRDKAAKNPVSHWKVSKRGVVGMCQDRGPG